MMSSNVALNVLDVGMRAVTVDSGRVQQARYGVTRSGPADRTSFTLANRLCGIDDNAASLEVLMGQFSFSVDQPCSIAVTGAPNTLRVAGAPQEMWQTVEVRAGQTVSLDSPTAGLINYVSVAGGLSAPVQFGSACTVDRECLGGMHGDGSPLKRNDQISVNMSTANTASNKTIKPVFRRVPHYLRLLFPDSLTLRVVEGYQFGQFSPLERARFANSEFTLSPDTSKMGGRLAGPAISWSKGGIVSEGIALGAVQIPPDGQPIVLLQDRQTIGGYPKLGSVLSLDCYALSQARPGTTVRFEFITVEDAHNLLHLHRAKLNAADLSD